jgi:hypothetical protein
MKKLYIIALLLAGCDAAPVYTSPADTLVQQEADRKVQRVIQQLQADCDTSLQKETYRRAQQLLPPRLRKPAP